MGVWTYKQYTFKCAACSDTITTVAGKCPKWCGECRGARTSFSAVMRGDNYPRKLCRGCGVHMQNFGYGREQFCVECADIHRKRANGWADPYAGMTQRELDAANDNVRVSKCCSRCGHEKLIEDFHIGATCKDCRRELRKTEDRMAEYEKRALKHGVDRVKNRRIRLIEKWQRRRVAERRKHRRESERFLLKLRERESKPWLAPDLTDAEKFRIRYANDNEYMLRERTRQRLRRKGFGFNILWRIRQSLNGEVRERGNATIERALGYSMSDLRAHLEGQFTDGMSWDAFREGRIHIDHKTPISRFDLDDAEQVLEAWSLDNLQPLWAVDNMSKGAKTDEEWRAAA